MILVIFIEFNVYWISFTITILFKISLSCAWYLGTICLVPIGILGSRKQSAQLKSCGLRNSYSMGKVSSCATQAMLLVTFISTLQPNFSIFCEGWSKGNGLLLKPGGLQLDIGK